MILAEVGRVKYLTNDKQTKAAQTKAQIVVVSGSQQI